MGNAGFISSTIGPIPYSGWVMQDIYIYISSTVVCEAHGPWNVVRRISALLRGVGDPGVPVAYGLGFRVYKGLRGFRV